MTMRSIKTGSPLVALVAVLLLGACGSGDIGDILGGPSGRAPEQIKGIVSSVDTTGDCRIELDSATQSYLDNRDSGGIYGDRYGSRATVYCDNATRVVFQGQTYRPESLERGDEVIVAVRDVGGRLIADRIDVTYDVTSGDRYGDDRYSRYPQDDRYDRYGETLGEDVRGTVRRVDRENRSLTLERVEYVDRGLDRGSDLLTLYYDADTEVTFRGQSYRPENLEVGDVVAVDVDTVRGTLVADDIRVLADARDSSASYPPR
jgi:hypothetical protein